MSFEFCHADGTSPVPPSQGGLCGVFAPGLNDVI